jgi:gluconate 2-dehydrogenase gamma chain
MKKKPKDGGTHFERRDFLKLMTSVQAAALISVTPFASEVARAAMPPQPADPAAPDTRHPKALSPHEWRTIRILADWILPADERSGGAIQAGVPEFLDDWLDWKRGDLLAEIQGGLTWLDMESNRSFGSDFAGCSSGQQKRILDRIAYPEKAAPEDAGAVAFFNTLRDLVVSGYFTSRTGIRDLPYVGNEPQSGWNGCPSEIEALLGVGRKKRTA